MDSYEVTDTLIERLTSMGLHEGKRQLDRVNKKAGSARQDAHRQVPRQGGDFGGIGMSKTKGFRVIREEPLLLIIDGGRA